MKVCVYETFSKGWGDKCYTSHSRVLYRPMPTGSCCSLHQHPHCHATLTDGGGIWPKTLENFKAYTDLQVNACKLLHGSWAAASQIQILGSC